MAQLAIIIPLGPVEGGGGIPTHPIAPGGPPPGIWPSPGYPAHPIAPGGPPPGIWPSPGYPAHPIAPGGPPPGIWPSPGYPAHPIAPGGPPPGIWPSPGVPTHPIAPGGPPSSPPSTEGDWVYSPLYGWVWMPAGSGGKPIPAPPEGGEAPSTPTPA
jgi:hypothetical protein